MTINGIDVTIPFSIICGAIWIILYFSLVYFVITRKPKNITERRWKASLLVGGLPVLGMPLLLPFILLAITVLSILSRKGDISNLTEFLPTLTASFAGIVFFAIPFSVFISIFATIGSYRRFIGADKWLNTIVPPSKDEKPNVHE